MQQWLLLTGGIGSGKSAAGDIFREFGAEVISADEAGHAVLAPGGEAVTAVAERWPEAVRRGVVDRQALAALVFPDPDALAELEALTHPAIAQRILGAVEASDASVVMVETPVPRIVTDGWAIIVVDAPEAARFDRLRARGMDDDDVSARMARQPSRGEWLTMADYVIDNSGDRSQLAEGCRAVWSRIVDGD